ncbi:type I restriction endonuclease subunit R, EcoR124 family [Schaalia sp. ORNL0103]|uniref:type I restriction endonuclease subunit R, EcoR124 family n=1 Tax=Schaalia sp. ORNL0103 TaxID=2789426 RepID=UPI001CA5A37B|nr:HsdR family type I site-specific deoxyribonuclease [Schaalia sp. ORNL0103]MBW6413494.1 HsdR family type I site-specific deoxyribonuclease [Schaalia sp. ORNL0103]
MAKTFSDEKQFEDAVIEVLQRNGWTEVLDYPSEAKLLDNWARILFENNRSQDRLGDVPLTSTEMDQVIEQILALRTPLRLNEFINGRTVAITRDATEAANFGVEVSLKIYDRLEIAGGQSCYQIARQPRYKASNKILPPRRGDLVLLINGMPVIHIELKRSGVPVSQAYHQIEKYAHEGIFSGLFSLVQVFVAMTPDQTRYFANPGPDGVFNEDFYFQWADFDNEPINQWDQVIRSLLAIPMAHQLIGFYTVVDRAAGVLMVMRSYQYNAANRIADRVLQKVWGDNEQRGGYIWHTTGSGKTVTSFKTAQLIADSKNADKVIFLLDRIELGTQSLKNYRSYGGDAIEVAETSSAQQLLTKLKDDLSVLIVTSIQKMSMLNVDEVLAADDVAALRRKRIVFVVDEAHRSTFGEMLMRIKKTLPDALFFGFTGTPIHDENQRKHSTTATLFGDELHRYSIADGIRDKNVLGFDPEMVETYRARDLRKQVALQQARAIDEAEVFSDPQKTKIFNRFMDKNQVPMVRAANSAGKIVRGIEDYLPTSQYERAEHREAVVTDIMENWVALSQNSKFHALFATSSIPEAIEYYRIFTSKYPFLAVTALFDPNIDNTGDTQLFKEDGLVEVLSDYNARFGQNFSMSTYDKFKTDVAARLAHKEPHNGRDFSLDKQINLLIVVDQMLTGFDSKWLNTLYLDKVLAYENIIQAFSRTNRIFGPDKPFGSIRYYRRPYMMKENIDKAVELYSGQKPMGLFVEHLDRHLEKINDCFTKIRRLFAADDFAELPESEADQGEFAKLFSALYHELQAASIQGFSWDKTEYHFSDPSRIIAVEITENDYLTLLQRYKELTEGTGGGGGEDGDPPFDIDTHITHIDTDRIDADYLNSKFTKYIRAREEGVPADELQAVLEEVHRSFARLSRDDQIFANLWLHDVTAGEASLVEGKTVEDYINDYKQAHQERQIDLLVTALGVDAAQVRALLTAHVTEANLNEYGRFTSVKESVDLAQAKRYLEHREGRSMSLFLVNREVEKLLRAFILRYELPEDLEVPTQSQDKSD